MTIAKKRLFSRLIRIGERLLADSKLLFGLGVDSGIHIIHRLRSMPNDDKGILRTSTARAIFFSGLTTLFSFVSLAFTSHLGLASMGQLLAIGITFIVFRTLIVLPAFAVKK